MWYSTEFKITIIYLALYVLISYIGGYIIGYTHRKYDQDDQELKELHKLYDKK